jgi:microsomal dipeptidase-like Zn-dependent dipeptidase
MAPEPPENIAAAIQSVGTEHCVMSTDYGQKKNVPPVEGMRLFIAEMLRCGIAETAIETMVARNPRALLDMSSVGAR